MRQLRMCLLGLLLLVAAPAVLCQSQLGTGAITGTVVDSNGAAIVGATVKVTNTATGVVRTVTTNNAGQFNAPVLPSGTYTVTIEQPGFSKIEQQNLEVNVGSNVTLNLEMKAGGATETINITAQPELDTTKTEESSLVNRLQISELPINGRRYDQFALLTPGVSRDGRFGLLSYHGQAGVFNNFTIEGNDDTQALFSEARGRTRIASSISSNAIQEFQVEQSSFLPEYGRSAGGGVNTTIRSGGNQVHGDGFWYFRNKAFNARDPLAVVNPSETRHQFGGSLSGPIKSDKAFFFFNYDQQRRNSPLVVTDTGSFNQPALATDFANFTVGCNDVVNRLKSFSGLQVSPGIRCDPSTTNPITNNQFIGTEARRFDQISLLGKVDINIDSRNTLTSTYNHLKAKNPEGIQTGLVLNNVGGNGFDGVTIDSVNERLTTTLDATKVNEMRFQFGRDFEFETGDQPGPNVSVGSFSFGQATFLQRGAFPNERRLQFVDNFSWSVGKHSIKFGGEVNRVREIIDNPAFFAGSYSYSSLVTYGNQLLNPTVRSYTTFRQNFGIPGLTFSTTDYAAFIQDQFKANRKLTVNYGLRYDYEQLPRPQFGNPAFPLTQSYNADRSNWGPRIGVAYDLRGNGKTVLRGGYGIYYGRSPNGTIENALLQTGFVDPTKSTIAISDTPTTAGAPLYPNLLPAVTANATGSSPFFLDPNFKRPKLQEMNFGIQRDLGHSMVLTASFVYDKGSRLPLNFDANMPIPTAANTINRTYTLPDGSTFTVPSLFFMTRANNLSGNQPTFGINTYRPNPAFGAITQVESVGETWYKGLLVELRRRFSNNLQFGISYTFAKAENEYGNGDGGGTAAEGPFGGGIVLNQFLPLDAFKSVAPTDQRHRFVFNGVYNVNLKTSSDGFNALMNGFELSGIFTAESGRPFSSVVGGTAPSFQFVCGLTQNQCPVFSGIGGFFGQGSAGNLLPTVSRNNNVGDANYKLDLRVTRNVKVSERFNMQFIVEGFNVFNRANFNQFNNTFVTFPSNISGQSVPAVVSPGTATVAPTFALGNSTTGNFLLPSGDAAPPDGTNARRVQVAIRFRF